MMTAKKEVRLSCQMYQCNSGGWTFLWEILIGIVVILILTSAALIIWIYRAVMGPIGKMQTAAQNIKEGNLDFELKPEADDELGKLCRAWKR